MTSIAPWLSVGDATAAVEFYRAAFGAAVLERLDDGGGRVAVAQLGVDGATFWVAEDDVAGGGQTVRMIVTVDGPDAWFDRAVAAGATMIADVHEEHGWRTGRVRDPFGHDWEFSRPVEAGG